MKRSSLKSVLRSALSLTLALVIFAIPCFPSFQSHAENDAIVRIDSLQDLITMVKDCRLDTYSLGKTFILSKDLRLNESYFDQIPVFRGTFDGGGHTIFGFNINNTIAPAGLFGIIEPEGVVKNLKLNGNITPSGDADAIGAIAGINRGHVEDCSFNGMVSGKNEVGGIVGINDFSGVIKDCRFRGRIIGEKKCGGIVGNNHGLIDSSRNNGLVNIDSVDDTIDIADIQSDLQAAAIEDNTEKKIYGALEDIGGIAGFSDGIITNCANHESVGYNHVGYNIGGIAGRNQGFIYGSTNYGIINGRREVGGVTGQAEPFVSFTTSSDNIGNLRSELHKLRDLVDKATMDVDASSSGTSIRLSNINDLISRANDNVKDLSDIITGYVDENLGEVNRGSDIVKSIFERLDSITEKLPDINQQITEVLNRISDGMGEAKNAGSKASDAMGDFTLASDDLNSALKILEDASVYLNDGVKKISESITVSENKIEKIEVDEDLLRAGTDQISKALDIMENGSDGSGNGIYSYLSTATTHLKDGMDKLKAASDILNTAFDYFKEAIDGLSIVSENITGVLDEVSSLADFLSNTEPLQFSYIKSRTEQAGNDLHGNITNISRELESLNLETKSFSDILMADIRAINDQFFVVMDLFVDELSDLKDTTTGTRIEDISEEDINNSTDGKVQFCRNYGDVWGDIDVGGIAGSMGIFNEQNPENDNSTISDTLLRRYKLKAILQDCTNYANITSKKDYVGAICGISTLGIITDCKGYGTATSEDGDYVGGISGGNSTAIRNSYAKCSLSGKKYIGGIAGLNSTKDNGTGSISKCVTAIEITSHEQYSGAICGYDEGEIQGNYFFGDYTGVNNASYSGKAEPVSYPELIAIENIPAEFKRFKLTFVANDNIIEEKFLDYLDSYNADEYPKIPPMDGQYGKWDKNSIQRISFDQIVTAIYSPYVTALGSAPETDGEPSKFLAIGKFSDDSSIRIGDKEVINADNAPANLPGEAFTFITPKESWTVTADDLMGDNLFLRYYKADTKGDKIGFYIKEGDSWKSVRAKEIGKYMEFEAPSGENTIIVADKKSYKTIVSAIAVVIIAGGLLFFIKKKKRAAVKNPTA